MIINGEERSFENDLTVLELLKELNIDKERVVVEVNFEIVPKESFESTVVNDRDKVEIVAFVGGG